MLKKVTNDQLFIYTSEICACYATRLSHIHSLIAVPLAVLRVVLFLYIVMSRMANESNTTSYVYCNMLLNFHNQPSSATKTH